LAGLSTGTSISERAGEWPRLLRGWRTC
jgi:hypothetical protein